MRRRASSGPVTARSVLRWPMFLLANVAVFLLVGISTLRETYRGWTVEREIHALEAQAQTLEGRKLKFATLASELASPEQIDLEARQRLGWKKEGEQVVVLAGYEASSGTSSAGNDAVTRIATESYEPSSNVGLWWKYFFERNP